MAQRYFVDELDGIICGQDAHHIKKVLRMQIGDEIIVCAKGICFRCVLKNIQDEITYEIENEIKAKTSLDITLYQGMPKGTKIETTLKYATMYGAKRIVLTDMIRSIQKGIISEQKMKRYQMIIKEASELSHRQEIPALSYVKNLFDVSWETYDFVLLADEKETKSLLDIKFDVFKHHKIAIIIGPEGGIDDQERAYLKQQKAISISLGSNILSSEIASLYALSALSLLNR